MVKALGATGAEGVPHYTAWVGNLLSRDNYLVVPDITHRVSLLKRFACLIRYQPQFPDLVRWVAIEIVDSIGMRTAALMRSGDCR